MNYKNCLSGNGKNLLFYGLGVVLLLMGQSWATAGELVTSRITLEGDHYLMYVVMDVKASYKKVYQHLTDYENLDKLSNSITESKVLYAAHPEYRIKVTTYSCIGFFCEDIAQVQNIKELSQGYIKASVVVEESDLDYGETLWHIQPHEGGTRITYISDIVPGFWVPPLIGTILFKSKLLEETRAIIEGLEILTNHRP